MEFKNVFEPKPQPKPEPKPLETVKPTMPKPQIPSKPIVQPPEPKLEPTEIAVTQALPNILIQQFKPTVTLNVETLDQPTTPLGRVIVILKNDAEAGGNPHRWTGNRIKDHVRNHAWDDNGIDEAIAQLMRWEILVRKSDGYLKFAPKRVNIVENHSNIGIQ